jgi:hypothetical protein
LPIHPYFRQAEPGSDVNLDELKTLYFASD